MPRLAISTYYLDPGTRVPVDFCEIPSHLMEHFVWDRTMLTKFAR